MAAVQMADGRPFDRAEEGDHAGRKRRDLLMQKIAKTIENTGLLGRFVVSYIQ